MESWIEQIKKRTVSDTLYTKNKIDKQIQDYLSSNGSLLGYLKPYFGMEVYYDGTQCVLVEQIEELFKRLERAFLW